MRPAMVVVFLLLLFLLLLETSQGIRFEEESLAAFHRKIDKLSSKGGGAAAQVLCKEDELCSGKVRKLMTKAMPSLKTEGSSEKGAVHHFIEETEKNKKTDNSKRPGDFHVEPPETYPDILDIAGMDYSPARRKPPIHN